MKTCAKCFAEKPIADFPIQSHGRRARPFCRACVAGDFVGRFALERDAALQSHPPPVAAKKCSRCKVLKLAADFYRSAREPCGLKSECVACNRSQAGGSREAYNARRRAQLKELRVAALAHYGGKCACCGESRYEFLAIDHVGGGGCVHRKLLGGGRMIGSWLRRNGYPDGFRVLCHNCNNAIAWYGACPHALS
jgi:hypothetical protein